MKDLLDMARMLGSGGAGESPLSIADTMQSVASLVEKIYIELERLNRNLEALNSSEKH